MIASGQRKPRGIHPMGRGAALRRGRPEQRPKFPHVEVIGYADGSGNNCLIHSLAQILGAAECGDRRPVSREKCVYVRNSLVVKYGCSLRAELELEVWRHLIVGELGGRPIDWGVLCMSCFGGESAECADAGEICARLRRTVGHPGHFAPIWPAIGGRVLAPLVSRREPPMLIAGNGEVEFSPDDANGISGARQDRPARPPVLIGECGGKKDAPAEPPRIHSRPLLREAEPEFRGKLKRNALGELRETGRFALLTNSPRRPFRR